MKITQYWVSDWRASSVFIARSAIDERED
jgi:hypothetical protein